MNLLCEQAGDKALEKTIREYNLPKNSVARDKYECCGLKHLYLSVKQKTTKVRKRKRLVCGSILNENVKSNGSFIGRQLGSSHMSQRQRTAILENSCLTLFVN